MKFRKTHPIPIRKPRIVLTRKSALWPKSPWVAYLEKLLRDARLEYNKPDTRNNAASVSLIKSVIKQHGIQLVVTQRFTYYVMNRQRFKWRITSLVFKTEADYVYHLLKMGHSNGIG